MKKLQIQGAGIGLRRPHIPDLKKQMPQSIDFFELAPENWMGMGGKRAKEFTFFAERYPMILHGLSLSLGSPAPLNEKFIKQIKQFLERHNIAMYSEHLSYCSNSTSQLYDLLPIPFTEEAVQYVAKRIKRVQEILERRIAIENISYYMTPGQEMSEVDFINAVLKEADCALLLDVNNVYVNSINHHYDAKQFIQSLKPKQIDYIHIAGHEEFENHFVLDTHGEDIINTVWVLLHIAYRRFGVIPTLLERDNNIPPLSAMLEELEQIKKIQAEEASNASE